MWCMLFANDIVLIDGTKRLKGVFKVESCREDLKFKGSKALEHNEFRSHRVKTK